MQSLKCRIYSIKRCGVYWKFRFIEAAFIQRRRLFEEGVLFKIIFLNIDNNYGITFENIIWHKLVFSAIVRFPNISFSYYRWVKIECGDYLFFDTHALLSCTLQHPTTPAWLLVKPWAGTLARAKQKRWIRSGVNRNCATPASTTVVEKPITEKHRV